MLMRCNFVDSCNQNTRKCEPKKRESEKSVFSDIQKRDHALIYGL